MVTKKILRASQDGKRPNTARLETDHTSGDGNFICDNLDGWAGRASFVVYETDLSGNPVAGTETDWIGTVSGNTISELKITHGEDHDYAARSTVLMACETAGSRNMLVEALGETLNEDGTFRSESIDASKIDVTNLNFAQGSIPGSAVKAEELDFPDGSIPMTALSGASGDDSQAKIYTDAEIAKLAEVARTGSFNDLKDKPASKKMARAVVGVSSAGYTENEVDYLCDGIDDQSEINEAINALPENGGEIRILDGTYNITAPVLIQDKKNVRLNGAGYATRLKRMWNSTKAEGVVEVKNAENATIVNIFIDNNLAEFNSENNKDLNADEISSGSIHTGETGGSGDFLSGEGGVEENNIRLMARWAREGVTAKEIALNISGVTSERGFFKPTGKKIYIALEGGEGAETADFLIQENDNYQLDKALRDAIALLGDRGGEIVVCPGEYRTSTGFNLGKIHNVKINGGGRAKITSTTGGSVDITTTATSFGIDIEGFCFSGFRISALYGAYVRILNNKFFNFSSNGQYIYLVSSLSKCLIIKNNQFDGGTIMAGYNHSFEKFVFEGNSGIGVSKTILKIGYSKFVHIKNNTNINLVFNHKNAISNPGVHNILVESNKSMIVSSEPYGSNSPEYPNFIKIKFIKNDNIVFLTGAFESRTRRMSVVFKNNKIIWESNFRYNSCGEALFTNNEILVDGGGEFVMGGGELAIVLIKNIILIKMDNICRFSGSVVLKENIFNSVFYRTRYACAMETNEKLIAIKNQFIGGLNQTQSHHGNSSAHIDNNYYRIGTSHGEPRGYSESNTIHDYGVLPKFNELIKTDFDLAQKIFPVGAEIPDYMDGTKYFTPWKVVHYGVATPAGGGAPKKAVFLMRKHTFWVNFKFDAPEPSNPDERRKQYGNNNYQLSNIAQWLNSDASNNSWWSATHTYDANSDYSYHGYKKYCSQQILEAVSDVQITAQVPTIDGGGIANIDTKFFLPSLENVGGGADTDNSLDGGKYSVVWKYFKDLVGNADSVDKRTIFPVTESGSGSYARPWWTRSFTNDNCVVRTISGSGAVGTGNSSGSNPNPVVCCCIMQD